MEQEIVVSKAEPASDSRGNDLLAGEDLAALHHPARLDLPEQAVERAERLLDAVVPHLRHSTPSAIEDAAITQAAQRLPNGVTTHVILPAQPLHPAPERRQLVAV